MSTRFTKTKLQKQKYLEKLINLDVNELRYSTYRKYFSELQKIVLEEETESFVNDINKWIEGIYKYFEPRYRYGLNVVPNQKVVLDPMILCCLFSRLKSKDTECTSLSFGLNTNMAALDFWNVFIQYRVMSGNLDLSEISDLIFQKERNPC